MAAKLEEHEKTALRILEQFFDCAIDIIEPINGSKRSSPDFIAHGVAWELKSPQTGSFVTLEKRLNEASRQSKFIVLDLRRMKIAENKTLMRLQSLLVKHKRIRKLLCIRKEEAVLEITRQRNYNKQRRGRAVPLERSKEHFKKLLKTPPCRRCFYFLTRRIIQLLQRPSSVQNLQ